MINAPLRSDRLTTPDGPGARAFRPAIDEDARRGQRTDDLFRIGGYKCVRPPREWSHLLTETDYAAFLDLLYGAAVEPGDWEHVIARFADLVGGNPLTQTIAVSGGPLLTNGVLYGIELSTSSTTTSTDWLTNSNVTVPDYSVCNVAFYCTDPNGLTPTSNAVYFTGTAASGPQFLYTINGVSSSGVPEPGAWAMLLAGLGGLGAALRMARRPTAVA
jgi:hypothetical protein